MSLLIYWTVIYLMQSRGPTYHATPYPAQPYNICSSIGEREYILSLYLNLPHDSTKISHCILSRICFRSLKITLHNTTIYPIITFKWPKTQAHMINLTISWVQHFPCSRTLNLTCHSIRNMLQSLIWCLGIFYRYLWQATQSEPGPGPTEYT